MKANRRMWPLMLVSSDNCAGRSLVRESGIAHRSLHPNGWCLDGRREHTARGVRRGVRAGPLMDAALMRVPDYITHARGYSEQPAPASGYQGMSCLLLGGRAAIRSTPGPLAALVLLAIRSSELATQLFKTTLKLL